MILTYASAVYEQQLDLSLLRSVTSHKILQSKYSVQSSAQLQLPLKFSSAAAITLTVIIAKF